MAGVNELAIREAKAEAALRRFAHEAKRERDSGRFPPDKRGLADWAEYCADWGYTVPAMGKLIERFGAGEGDES
jgi:septal ring factor EnvC (AmiA/AmiB activator)